MPLPVLVAPVVIPLGAKLCGILASIVVSTVIFLNGDSNSVQGSLSDVTVAVAEVDDRIDDRDEGEKPVEEVGPKFTRLPVSVVERVGEYLEKADFVRFASTSRWYFAEKEVDIKSVAELASLYSVRKGKPILSRGFPSGLPLCSITRSQEIDIKVRPVADGATPFWNLCHVAVGEEKLALCLVRTGIRSLGDGILSKDQATRIFVQKSLRGTAKGVSVVSRFVVTESVRPEFMVLTGMLGVSTSTFLTGYAGAWELFFWLSWDFAGYRIFLVKK